MVKLVDMPDLGSGAARRVGSSPIIRTNSKPYNIANQYFKAFLFLKLPQYPPYFLIVYLILSSLLYLNIVSNVLIKLHKTF